MRSWPRTRTITVQAGALVLLVYGASFFTRDWSSVSPSAEQPIRRQAAVKKQAASDWVTPPRAEASSVGQPIERQPASEWITPPRAEAATPTEAPPGPEPTASEQAPVETGAPPLTATPLRLRAQSALRHSGVRRKWTHRTKSPVAFRLAERGN